MIVLFEETSSVERLEPFSLVRPLHDLKSGIMTVYERIANLYDSEVKVISRKEVSFYFPDSKILSVQDISRKNEIIFLNTMYLYPSQNFKDTLNTIGLYNGIIVYLHINSSDISEPELLFDGLYKNDVQMVRDALTVNIDEVKIYTINNFCFYPWDLVYLNTFLIEKDFEILSRISRSLYATNIELEGSKDMIIISPKANISKGVFIDVSSGPVYIDTEARINSLTVITGPAYIGKRSVVSQARIREGSNIRNVCKVSGEVEETIIDSYSNKNHEGFIGHSYVGQWVNIGAMATNSDLKNTYDEVKVFIKPNKIVNTGLLKVGCFIGDFSKIGIGVLINTGTIIGVGANVFFEGELVRKYVPHFAWGGREPYKRFPLDRFINMTRVMFSRRDKVFDKFIEDLIRNLYNSARE
ncbi:MAG: putative sugar nucleotidyl transferase [Brevinematales bacterium]|nr:putative sugar nucleotidyl transferase [Brevinematales bacterium]